MRPGPSSLPSLHSMYMMRFMQAVSDADSGSAIFNCDGFERKDQSRSAVHTSSELYGFEGHVRCNVFHRVPYEGRAHSGKEDRTVAFRNHNADILAPHLLRDKPVQAAVQDQRRRQPMRTGDED